MAKAMKALTIDVNVWEDFQQIYPQQASSMVNDFLKNVVNSAKRDKTSVNIMLEKKKLEKDVKNFNKLKATIDERTSLIKDYEELKNKKEVEKLEAKKKEMEKLTVCFKCQSPNVFNKYENKPICKNCFMNL